MITISHRVASDLHTFIEGQIAATARLQPPATFTPDAAISREIRDRLAGKDVLEVRVAKVTDMCIAD